MVSPKPKQCSTDSRSTQGLQEFAVELLWVELSCVCPCVTPPYQSTSTFRGRGPLRNSYGETSSLS